MIALRHVVAHAAQVLAGGFVFHAFGNRLEREFLPEARNGSHDASPTFARDRQDERAVDFEVIDGQLLQVIQRRVARAEVVDGNASVSYTHLDVYKRQNGRSAC